MRDAKHGQTRRAVFTLAVRLTPFAGALQSFPRSMADHKLARGAVGRRQDFCLWKENISPRAISRARSLEIEKYLTKVREWTKAGCKAFAASIAL
jgi:hypothetical protein